MLRLKALLIAAPIAAGLLAAPAAGASLALVVAAVDMAAVGGMADTAITISGPGPGVAGAILGLGAAAVIGGVIASQAYAPPPPVYTAARLTTPLRRLTTLRRRRMRPPRDIIRAGIERDKAPSIVHRRRLFGLPARPRRWSRPPARCRINHDQVGPLPRRNNPPVRQPPCPRRILRNQRPGARQIQHPSLRQHERRAHHRWIVIIGRQQRYRSPPPPTAPPRPSPDAIRPARHSDSPSQRNRRAAAAAAATSSAIGNSQIRAPRPRNDREPRCVSSSWLAIGRPAARAAAAIRSRAAGTASARAGDPLRHRSERLDLHARSAAVLGALNRIIQFS